MRKVLKILFLIVILLNVYVNGETNGLAINAKDRFDINKRPKNDNYYPYQEGFPVFLDGVSLAELSTVELYGQMPIYTKNLKGVFMGVLSWDLIGTVRVYDWKGELIANPDFAANPPVYIDFNFDGIKEIVANKRCPHPWDCYGLGATVARLNGWELNGFPNPSMTALWVPSVEDIDRDGNYDIVFSTHALYDPDKNIVGAFIIGSWGGVFPGFPVLFPYWEPVTPSGLGNSYWIVPIGDFDEDGYLEIVPSNGHGIFIIRMDGSYFRNWPVRIHYGIANVSLGDIDNDRKLEVVAGAPDTQKMLFVFNEDGSDADNFPVKMDCFNPAYAVEIADTNEDGFLEMYIACGCSPVAIGYNYDGKLLPNFPMDLRVNGYPVCPDSILTIADIDDDGEYEIVSGGSTCELCPDGVIFAFNLDGTLVEGFPIVELNEELENGITIDDLDSDGDVEICAGTYAVCYDYQPNYLYCYDLPYRYNPKKVAWKDTSNSNMHTNRYYDLRVEVPVVYRVEPGAGSYRGGTRVVIKGNYFREGARVFFGGIEATEVQVIDSETIYAKTPPHKPCNGYINDLSVSPYKLSEVLINQKVVNGGVKEGEGYSMDLPEAIGSNGCVVNVVVAHPSPDQREGILRAGYTYTGYEPTRDDIVLYVSKHVGKGTFENGLGYWEIRGREETPIVMEDSWHVVEDGKSKCIQRYGSNNKFIWFGEEWSFNYDRGYLVRNDGWVETPIIYIEDEESALSFWYYRDVELNYLVVRDITEVKINPVDYDNKWYTIWYRDSRDPSEKEWVWSGWISLAEYAGKYASVRFYFDNVLGGVDDNHIGWAIDDVQFRNARWRQDTSEIILEWEGGIPKYFVYRSRGPNYEVDIPELRGYMSLHYYVENSYNNDEDYYYKVR